MKRFLLILLTLIPIFAKSQDKVKFIANGVTCSMCSNAIHKSLKSNKEILTIEPNLETQEWNLLWSKDKFEISKLIKLVESAGFSVGKVWLNEKIIFEQAKKKKRNTF